MEEFVLVAVSPFYNGRGWTDTLTGVDFKPVKMIYPIRISKKHNLSGIQNSVRLNNLLLLEGSFDLPGEELDIKNINPEELTREQFAVLAEKLKGASDDGITQEDVDKVTRAKEAVEAELATAKKAKEAVEEELAKSKTAKEEADTKAATATSEKELAITQKTAAEQAKEKAETELTTYKKEYFTKHTFTEEDVSDGMYTIAVLKEILDAKSISYLPGDNKATLVEKLIAA